jgi:flagellar basal body-associated protein FliL
MTRAGKILLGVAVAVIIIVTVLVTTLFTSNSYLKEQSKDFKEKIARQDSAAKDEQQKREALLLTIAQANASIATNKADAAASLTKVESNKPFYQDNTKKYESIPVSVKSLTNDSLASAIERYYQVK